ncbi:MAG: histidine phosphatase family protein [Flavobacteriales bacterium]|nr:histidine phosphatase family protein [Flavobacteriales bacterium]
MKRLYINRHAKSSWNHPGLSDFERPLNNRGFEDAPVMGERLKNREVKIDRFLSSPAKRAISTARIMAEYYGYDPDKIVEIPSIYHASNSMLLDIINGLDDKLESVILFGHNPGFTEIVNYLAGPQISNMPTCGICCIDFDTDEWKLVSRETGKLEFFDYPKNV